MNDFLAVFFGRAADVVRRQFGPTAYIDASGPEIAIVDSAGVLGRGETLRDAIAAARSTFETRKPLETQRT